MLAVVYLILGLCWIFLSSRASPEEEALPEFQTVLGSTAHLPCEVPHRPASSGIKCIFWYKDDEVMSVYTVDARDSQSQHVPSERLKSRAQFDPSPWPPILRLVAVKEPDAGVYYCRVDYRWDRTYMYTVVLKVIGHYPSHVSCGHIEINLRLMSVKEPDAGVYYCRVDYRWDRTYRYTVVLKVIVPPQKLAILNDHDEEIVGTAGPYLEGQSVTLTCEAIGGKPSPFLSWWRGHEPLKGSHPVSAHGQVRSDYTFIPSRSDLLTTLTCRSVNNNITAPHIVSVQIDLYLKPVDVRMTPQPMSFTAGRKVELRCYSGGSRPPSRMSWFLDNDVLSNHTDLLSIDGNRTTSILAFWPSRSDHNKYLRCRAENFLLSNSALEDGYRLNITYVPQVSLSIRSSTKGPQASAFLEGDDVRLTCDVKANPPASEVGWLFEGRPLNSDDPEIVLSFKSLLVRRVKKAHRGRYQCYANNAEGTGLSRVINLRAMYAPVCRTGLQKTYTVSADILERVECQVDADPPKVDFSWSFSNAVDRHYNVSYTSAGLRSVASYKPKTARDYGTLYCWGKNAVGEQQTPCIFLIIPVGPPETLQNCTSVNVTMSSVTVTCIKGSRQDSDMRYNLDMFKFQSHELEYQTSASEPQFVITNLTTGTEYLFAVYAVNSNGKSAPQMVRVWTRRTPSEERVYRERESGLSDTWLGSSLLILAAFSCFLLFTAGAAWSRFRGGPGCQKCKELPKQLNFKKKRNKTYIDCQGITKNGHLASDYPSIAPGLEIKPSII